jgi:hypothetical protein
VAKKLKHVRKPSPPLQTSQGTWVRNKRRKSTCFRKTCSRCFQPYPSENEPEEEEAIIQLLEPPYQLEPSIKHFSRAEVQEVVGNQNPKKSSGYDLIIGKILKELPIIRTKYLNQLFGAVLLKGYFLAQGKVAQVILILKPGNLLMS